MKRHKLDSYVTDQDIRQVFNYVDEGKESLPVSDFLKKVEEVEFNRSELNHEQQKIRDFLELQIAKKRSQSMNIKSTDPDIEALKKQKAVHNEAEMMRKALGMKTYSLDVDHEELNEVIENAFDNQLTNEEQRKYKRFLHHSNLKLGAIPFYDTRATDLDRLKHRAATIHKTLEDPQMVNKFSTISENYHRGSLTTSHSMDFIRTFKPVDRYKGISGWDDSVDQLPSERDDNNTMKVSQSLSNLSLVSARPSPLSASSSTPVLATLSTDQKLPSSAPSATIDEPITDSKKSGRNLITDSARGAEFQSIASSSSPMDRSARKLQSKTPTTSSHPHIYAHEYEVHMHDFLPTIIGDNESMGRMKDSTKVLRLEKVDPVVEVKQGRRLCEENINRTCHLSTLNQSNDFSSANASELSNTSSGVLAKIAHHLPPGALKEDDHFQTTNNKFYCPLIYKPSQPVTRDAVSEGEIQFRIKEYRRAQRHERLKANMDVTKTRLEYEAMQKELRGLHRQHARVEDNIRYKTAIFLQDLRAFRTQPLQRMAKRQNIELSDKMWGGNQERLTVGIAPEERDFATTYRTSYDSSILSQSMNINSLEGLKPSGSVH